MIEITEKKIDVAALLESVLVPEAGGIDIFLGTTRNHSRGKKVVRLEYEAYIPMAVKIIGRIENEIRARWNIHKISIIHRIGVVPLEEASVGIAVSASHRNEAFEACRYAIDQLKKSAPIWKKEIFENDEAWVEAGGHVEKSRNERK
jgi:molybdopterin synthase catalytic subunit